MTASDLTQMNLRDTGAQRWARDGSYLSYLFLSHLSVEGGMDDFRAPDAEKKVSGLLTKCVRTNAEAPGGTQRKHLLSYLLSLMVTCPSLRRAH